jgi:hypothetical protein
VDGNHKALVERLEQWVLVGADRPQKARIQINASLADPITVEEFAEAASPCPQRATNDGMKNHRTFATCGE